MTASSGATLSRGPPAGGGTAPVVSGGGTGAARATSAVRLPNTLPYPDKPPGEANPEMPFDHLIVVMMENHSLDNLLGELPLLNRPDVDGLKFDAAGNATNSNPDASGTPVMAFPFPLTGQGRNVLQSWNATHKQIDGGKMDGFVTSVGDKQPMGYYPREVLPFAYSLASTFTLANGWFSSAPCPTFPNRRFLMAGTAYGGISTALETLADPPPPNGTIFDRLDAQGISWRNYFTDIPQTAIIPSIVEHHIGWLAPINEFYEDCASGHLPASASSIPRLGCCPRSARP